LQSLRREVVIQAAQLDLWINEIVDEREQVTRLSSLRKDASVNE